MAVMCISGCGREATVKKHQLCAACYAGCRNWSNVKTPTQRRQYHDVLVVRLSRLALIDEKRIVIGKSPYSWKANSATNVIRLNFRRQRGNVR